jgi:alpha-tubulin suppressor-like RCC1 family protein
VLVGGEPLGDLQVLSPTAISGTTPAGDSAGASDVLVTGAEGEGRCAGCFTYFDPTMRLTAVSPDTGPLAGGTPVTLTGANLGDVVGVTIDGRSLANLAVQPERITGTMPASLSPGPVRIVARSATDSGACDDCFDYLLDVPAVPLAAGAQAHTCVLTATGTASCWGWNSYGQLGRGTVTVAESLPAPVAGGLTFRAITAADHHTCALTASGTAYCWGRNNAGHLGDGTTEERHVPTLVDGDLLFSSITAAGDYTCGLSRAGDAYCWGWNGYGQLGSEAAGDAVRPVRVAGDIAFRALTAGHHHACGLDAAGNAHCWGSNSLGQLGTGNQTPSDVPAPVSGGWSFVALAAGADGTCGLVLTGRPYCWGNFGTLPGPVGDSVFGAVTRGGNHGCALASSSGAYCWGFNLYGQVGDSTTSTRGSPTPVHGGHAFRLLSAGGGHTCGVTVTNELYCWGSNGQGQLGDGTRARRLIPVVVNLP